ncbi:hypothetical protein, partial [Streptomyces sp. NPDC058855]|uniref:hypothetical protein n=1 Tax=Streptomyces sp. NPDC058855 TaxID=3346651 RepID=UPI00369DB741
MFDRLPHARRRRLARTAVPVTAAALLLGLLPVQALAVPPDPVQEEIGREALALEELEQETPVPEKDSKLHLETLRADVPPDLLAAPANTTTPPAGTGSVTFGSATGSVQPASTVQRAALTPAGSLPVSLGQATDQPAPTGTWQVTIPERTTAVGQGVDGAVMVVEAPATGAVPVSVKLDYSRFQSLYGADWASRLRFVQFPDCYLTTPDDEA